MTWKKNDDCRGVYSINSFFLNSKLQVLKSNLYDCNDAYILLKKTITITGPGTDPATRQADERNKQQAF